MVDSKAAVDSDSVTTSRRRARSRRRAASWERTSALLLPVVAFVLIIAIWEVWVRVGHVSRFILPPPSAIARQAGIFDQLWPDLRATLGRIIYGFLLAAGIGFVIAVGIVTFRPFSRAVYPILIGTQVIPKLAIAPLFLVWFGYGGFSTIMIVFLLAFFPVVINTTHGLRSTEIEKLFLARSIGASWLDTFLKIRLPNALPSIFGGLEARSAALRERRRRRRVHQRHVRHRPRPAGGRRRRRPRRGSLSRSAT